MAERSTLLRVINGKRLAVVVIALLVVPMIISSMDKVSSQPNWISDKKEIRAGKIIIRIPRIQPEYFITTYDKESLGYVVKFSQLIEFDDANGNKQLDDDEMILSRGVLCGKATWNINVRQNDTFLQVNLSTYIRVIHHGPMAGPPKKAFIEIINTVFTRDTVVNGYDILGEREIKIDFIIRDWPWRSEKSVLLLRILFETSRGGISENMGKMQHRHTVDSKRRINSITMRDPSLSYGILFRIRSDINVDASNSTLLSLDWRNNNTLDMTYPHFNQLLRHDPSIRIIDLVTQTIGITGWVTGSLILILSVAISVASVSRLRKRLVRL